MPSAHNSSSSPDKAIIPPPPPTADDFKQFQELFKRVANSLEIPLQGVAESEHKLLKILHTSSKIALPMDDAVMVPAK